MIKFCLNIFYWHNGRTEQSPIHESLSYAQKEENMERFVPTCAGPVEEERNYDKNI